MFERIQHHRTSAITGIALLAVLGMTGCIQEEKYVCSAEPEHLVLVPSTSKTDYDVSAEMTPEVSKQVVRRAALSCGRVTVGIQDSRPQANLELSTKSLVPEDKKAYDADDATDDLIEAGEEFVQAELIAPLGETKATGGSPFLSALIKIGDEVEAHDWPQGTIVLVGDGLVVEPPPAGGPQIHFGTNDVTAEDLNSFVPLLESLQGSCVVLVGAGATSKAPGHLLRASQELFGETLERAGVGFVATRSAEVPARC
jgi:hypothetical protein